MNTGTGNMAKYIRCDRGDRGSANEQTPRMLTGRELLDDMARFARELRANPQAARQFLRDLGVLTESGKPRRLIRGRRGLPD